MPEKFGVIYTVSNFINIKSIYIYFSTLWVLSSLSCLSLFNFSPTLYSSFDPLVLLLPSALFSIFSYFVFSLHSYLFSILSITSPSPHICSSSTFFLSPFFLLYHCPHLPIPLLSGQEINPQSDNLQLNRQLIPLKAMLRRGGECLHGLQQMCCTTGKLISRPNSQMLQILPPNPPSTFQVIYLFFLRFSLFRSVAWFPSKEFFFANYHVSNSKKAEEKWQISKLQESFARC